MGIALIVGKHPTQVLLSFRRSPLFLTGAKARGIGYTKGLPEGAPPEAQFTYLSPEIILTEKVRCYGSITFHIHRSN